MANAVKKTISLPLELAKEVEEMARDDGKTVSAWEEASRRLQVPIQADSLLFSKYGIQVFEKSSNILLQLGSDLAHPEEEFLELLPIEFKPVSFAKKMSKSKIFSQYFLGVWRYDRWSQTLDI